MTPPGPPLALWAVSLALWAGSVAVLGELVRLGGARWVGFWRAPEAVERTLLDLYLGGAVFYLIAAVPVGAFSPAVVYGLPIAAAVLLLVRAARVQRGAHAAGPEPGAPAPAAWPLAVALASAGALFLVELTAALPVATGNTYDSSLLTTYTALLLHHGSTPTSFRPYASVMILYPQGTTVWLGSAQLVFGLPPARTALLVTPLFLGLAPLSGYVFGQRVLGSARAGAAVAVTLAWFGPSTRALVGGSNDFAIAFPLVLWLLAESPLWLRRSAPSLGDAVGFGVLVGYSAALNPVGAEWLVPALLAGAWLARGGPAGAIRRWLGRWAAMLGTALVGIAPTLYVLGLGWSSPGFVPGSAAPTTPVSTGLSGTQLLGSVDPFLFGARDVALSGVPILRAELAVLLAVGLGILVYRSHEDLRTSVPEVFRGLFAAGFAAIVVGLLILTVAHYGLPGGSAVASLTSGAELSLWLFAWYGLVAALPLVWLFDRAGQPPATPAGRAPTGRRASRRRPGSATLVGPATAAVIAVALVAPGLVLTPTSFASTLTELYGDFSQVSAGDFALLAHADALLAPGSRVLVAPGSVAEFLPGYVRDVAILYPLVPGWQWINASYTRVLSELTNDTLDAAGRSALLALGVTAIAVTMANTVLWPPFAPGPLIAEPAAFDPVFHDGDAYLFSVNATEL